MNKIIDKLAWIQIQDKKILSTRSRGKSVYYIPGGKREVGETDQQALSREIKEELSIELLPATIDYMGTFKAQADGYPDGTIVKMTCYTAEYEGEIIPNSEIEEVVWFTYNDKNKSSAVDKLIMDKLMENGLIQ